MRATSFANTLVAHYETNNPFALCKQLGITIIFHDLMGVRGYYAQEQDQHFIVIAKGYSEAVTAYICAHELAHFLFHKGLNRIFMDSHTFMVQDKYENEADQFALELLYPFYSEQPYADTELAECLNVPLGNLCAKIEELGR